MNKEQNCVNEGYIDSFRLYQMKCCLSVVTPGYSTCISDKIGATASCDFIPTTAI